MATIDALLGLGLEDPNQTQALADSLRGRKRAADMFSLSTVGNIAKGAQREQDSIMEGAQRGGVLRQAMADRQSKIDEGKLDRDSRELISGNALKETMRNNKATTNRAWAGTSGNEYINPLTGETVTAVLTPEGLMRTDGSGETLDQNLYQLRDDPNTSGFGVNQRFDDREETRRVEKLDAHIRNYGRDLDQSLLPRVMKDIEFVDSMLTTLPGFDADSGDYSGIEEIPGIGYAQNTPVLGAAISAGEDIFSGKDDIDATQMRGAIQRLLNTEIREQSGAAVTLHEMVRNATGAAADWSSSDADFLRFWPQIKAVLAEIKGGYDAAYGPEAVGLYDLRKSGNNLTSREFLEGDYLSGEAEGLPEGTPEGMAWMMDEPDTWTEEQTLYFEKMNGL